MHQRNRKLVGEIEQLKDFLVRASQEGSGYVGLHDTVIPSGDGKTLMDVLAKCF